MNRMDGKNGQNANGRQSERLGSEITRAARKVAAGARRQFEADQQLKRLMTARYGEHDELPDSIVEAVQYGGGDKDITLAWIDAEMTAAGYPPNQTAKRRSASA